MRVHQIKKFERVFVSLNILAKNRSVSDQALLIIHVTCSTRKTLLIITKSGIFAVISQIKILLQRYTQDEAVPLSQIKGV